LGFGNWTKQERKARKRHLCDECGELIMPGEIYAHWKICGSYEGIFSASEDRLHLECDKKLEQEAKSETTDGWEELFG